MPYKVRIIYNNDRRLQTENKQGSRWHVATGVQVRSDLDIYNYMVVYIVVKEVMKKLLKNFGQKYIYIIEITYHRLSKIVQG